MTRRAFNEKKQRLAEEFLTEIDDKVAGGKVASLAASTGGVRLIWSKKLNSTAGRANWKQEKLKATDLDEASCTKYRHHASIELAEKVIDDEGKSATRRLHSSAHKTSRSPSQRHRARVLPPGELYGQRCEEQSPWD